MLFDVEVLLRETDRVVTETVEHEGNEPPGWTEQDVRAVLEAMLLAIDRVKYPAGPAKSVVLRGLSWIVDEMPNGVVIALEIPSGAAVAGPFAIPSARLDGMIARVLASSGPSRSVH